MDINGEIAKSKGYSPTQVVLETPTQVLTGYHAWLKILSQTKHKWITNIVLRPVFIIGYFLVSKNRKLISKL